MNDDYNHMQELASHDVEVIREKNAAYGASWRKRGGAGAFMMLARKWDRIEVQVEKFGYDVFAAAREDGRDEGLLDDIRDLRRYLLLVESHLTAPRCGMAVKIDKDFPY